MQRKACGLLNVNGYYDPLLAMADKAVEEGFVRADHREILLSDVDPERLLDRLSKYLGPSIDNDINHHAR
jgi:predicted Rossmann-fold nucleotide-binding protein